MQRRPLPPSPTKAVGRGLWLAWWRDVIMRRFVTLILPMLCPDSLRNSASLPLSVHFLLIWAYKRKVSLRFLINLHSVFIFIYSFMYLLIFAFIYLLYFFSLPMTEAIKEGVMAAKEEVWGHYWSKILKRTEKNNANLKKKLMKNNKSVTIIKSKKRTRKLQKTE